VKTHPALTILTKTIDLKGNIWMGLFSWVMLAGLIRCVLFSGPDLPGGALGLYGTVLATFGITKLGAKAINGKNGHQVGEND
jgi:hypothetical protein